MKICILSLRLDLAGGVERVVPQVASLMAQKHQVRIGIVDQKSWGTYYPLDERVVMDDLTACRKKIDMRTVVRRIIYMTGWTLPPGLAKQVFYAPARIRALEKYLREQRFDVVIAAANEPSLLLSLIDRQRAGCENTRLYGWFHNSYQAYFYEKKAYYYGRQSLAKKSLKRLDGLIALTQQDARVERKQLRTECQCIYNPLSFQSEKKSGLNQQTLLFVGRMQYHAKGLDYLLQVAKRIFSEPAWKEWKLIVAGDGKDKKRFEREVRAMGLSGHVECIGEQRDIRETYLRADILLSTSRWEGFGLVITEAFECGVPVVAFRNAGPGEIIEDGGNGYLVDRYDVDMFAERVKDLMGDEDRRKSFAKRAIERAEDFSAESVREQWEKIIAGIS